MSESIKGLKRTDFCASLTKENIGKQVVLMGWVQKRRNLGSLLFVDLRDRTGVVQILFDENSLNKEIYEKANSIRNEFVIAIIGEVAKRSGVPNENLKTGEIEVIAKDIKILSKANTPPFPIEEGIDTKEEIRLKYRTLDLRRKDIQQNIITRSRATSVIRNFLIDEGFLEIETPILTKSTPEGARDYLVPSRVHAGSFYALPQSPQLFKQMLMCAGFDKYMQIARCFRDEDLRADRQPEFTQVDLEMSFVTEDDVIDLTERLLVKLFKEVLNIDVDYPFLRMPYKEAMERFGSDKPDIRFSMELKDISNIVSNSNFSVFTNAIKNGGSVRGIKVENMGDVSRKKIDSLVEFAKGYEAKGLAYIQLQTDGNVKSSFSKFMTEEEMDAIKEEMKATESDLLLFVADTNKIVFNTLSALRLLLANELGLIKKDEYKFLWVTDFPAFEWSEEEGRFVSMHHPFTMPQEEDLEYLKENKEKVRAKAYDVVLNGIELGGGSVRIHQADIQEKMFEALSITSEAAKEKFGFLLDAFSYGVPPHAGLALGLDRIIMLMTKAASIRDVIAFPKVKDASCMLTNAPDVVDVGQLNELHIRTIEGEENANS